MGFSKRLVCFIGLVGFLVFLELQGVLVFYVKVVGLFLIYLSLSFFVFVYSYYSSFFLFLSQSALYGS